MNVKLKVGFLVVVIILIFIVLCILKTNKENKKNNYIFNKSIIPVIEKFTNSCLNLKNEDVFCITDSDTEKIKDFRQKMNGGKNSEDQQDLIEIINEDEEYKFLTKFVFRDSQAIHNEDKKFFIFGPSGISFDGKNDDLIAFDLGILRRFHCRENRELDVEDLQPRFEFYPNMKEIENQDEMNKYKLVKYIESYLKQTSESYSDITLEIKDIDKKYKEVLKKLNSEKKSDFEVLVITQDFNEYKEKNQDLGLPYFDKEEDFNNSYGISYKGIRGHSNYKNEIAVLYNNFLKYKSKIDCLVTDDISDINNCNIKYEQDLPKYQIGEFKGITELGFDDDPKTIYHTYMLDSTTNKTISPWEDAKYLGRFRPQISYYSNRYNDFEYDNFKEASTIPGIEPFTTSKLAYKLQDEYENIGVGMYLDSEFREIFVPDVENNRIQIFDIDNNNFTFLGQFGNINTISYRSLPTYQGEGLDSNEDVQTTNPLIGGFMVYEPIINNESGIQIEGYGKYEDYSVGTCNKLSIDNFKQKRKEYVSKGPLEIEKAASQYNCNVEFSSRRANIHEYKIDNTAESKRGHFYHLLSEYNRIIEKKRDYLRNKISNPQFVNPHHLGIKINLNGIIKEDNAINIATLAYRKVILKVIKETDEGQKFGQLFRPKSIAYDDEEGKDGNKFYVVDTFHHCIQCFERLEDKVTVNGIQQNFVSADSYYNDDLEKYLYDENFSDNNNENGKKYNKSKIYSLGARQKIISAVNKDLNRFDKSTTDIFDFYDRDEEITGLTLDWAKKYGQTYNNIHEEDKSKKNQEIVKLTRWISGKGIKQDDTTEPVFYSELDDDVDKKNYPGVGMFSYPSDIVICNNPYKEEKLMMITDMGNNRVCIFKKYLVEKDVDVNHYRFRFFCFLPKDIQNPLSITVSNFTGKVYVLDGNFPEQEIHVFKPEYKSDSKNKSKIEYISIGTNKIKDLLKDVNKEPYRISKIRIDNRGILAMTDMNNQSIYVVGEAIDLKNQEIEKPIIKTTANKISFNFQLSFLDRKLNLPNMNRFRIFLQRQNISKLNDFYDLFISPEYLFSHNPLDIENRKKNNFIIEDIYSSKDFKKCWVTYKNSDIELVKIDNYDYVINKASISNDINTDIDKRYISKKFSNIYNKILEGYEDYFGESIKPNSSYKYNYGFYNYINRIKLNTSPIDLHTLPLGISPEDITKQNVVNDSENYIKLNIDYGSVSDLHRETQYYNPICFYIIRAKHNRTKDVSMKYLNLNKGNMIQLLVPNESKYIFSNFSKPKYGKLYVYNVYNPLDIKEQNKLMETGVTYYDTKLMLFYSAEGGIGKEGGYPIPRKKDVPTDFIDDYFTLGDNPKDIHKKIKFRVRIGLTVENDKVIKFDDNNTIDSVLGHYSKVKGVLDDYSFKKIYKLSAVSKAGENYSYGPITFCDKGTTKNPIESNQTYEYCIFTANPYRINPAVNTFYYTTKPEKVYVKEVKKVKEMVQGRQKNFLKILWYTPKNKSIYWPYNFLLMRKRVYNQNERIIMDSGITMEQDFIFNFKNELNVDFVNPEMKMYYTIDDRQIMINPESNSFPEFIRKEEDCRNTKLTRPRIDTAMMSRPDYEATRISTPETYPITRPPYTATSIATAEYGDDPYNLYNLQFIINLKEEKEWKIVFGKFDHMNIYNTCYNIKYIPISKKPKIQEEKKFKWTSKERYITFSGYQVHITINLKKGHTFRIESITETIIPKDQTEEIDNIYKKIDQKEEELEVKIREIIVSKNIKEKNDEIIKELERQRQIRKIGFHFTLTDDYQGYFDNIDNNKGYSGDLYRYLLPLKESDLLKIFDELHDKVKILSPQTDMRMDGPSGMMRSGGKEMLIDKIRHLSFLLREENQITNKALGVKCQDTTLKNLMSNNLGQCISNNYLEKKQKQEAELTQQMEERRASIQKSKRRRRALATQKLQLERKAQEADEQQFREFKTKLADLSKMEKEENAKIAEFSAQQQKEIEMKSMEENAESMISIQKNIIPDDLEKQLKQFSLKPLYIKGILKNHKYIGEPGSFSKFGSGSKIILGKLKKSDAEVTTNPMDSLLTFLKDLVKVIPLDKYKSEYEQMHGFGFDLERQEFYFFKKGVDILKDKENIIVAQNNIILLKSKEEKIISGENLAEVSGMSFKKPDKTLMGAAKLKKLEKELKEMRAKVRDEEDANIIRQKKLIERQKEIENADLSDWSFLKYGKPEFFFEEPLNLEQKKKIFSEYGIQPTMVSLSGSIINGEQLFKESELEKIENIRERNMIKKEMYVGHKQMIDIGSNPDDIKYEYRLAIYPTGFSFDEDIKRKFMGLDYITQLGSNSSNLPYLDFGEIFSDPIFEGSQVSNRKVVNKPFEPTELAPAPAPEIPIIKYFEPKFGYENTIVKIVGLRLDEIDYFCFRDIKVEILRKTEIKIDDQIYQMYLVKPPTLKDLNRECWQSLERYKVLVWGYYGQLGIQIRSSENKDNLNAQKSIMYTYNDRKKCSEDLALEIPK